MLLPFHLLLPYYPSSPPPSVRCFPTGGPENSSFLVVVLPYSGSFVFVVFHPNNPNALHCRNGLLVLVRMSRFSFSFSFFAFFFFSAWVRSLVT